MGFRGLSLDLLLSPRRWDPRWIIRSSGGGGGGWWVGESGEPQVGGWVMGRGSWTIGGLPDHQGWVSGGWMCVSGEPQVGRWVMGQVALDGSSDYQVFILCPRILRTFGLFFKWSNKLLNRSSKFIQRLVRIITVLRVGSTFKRVT